MAATTETRNPIFTKGVKYLRRPDGRILNWMDNAPSGMSRVLWTGKEFVTHNVLQDKLPKKKNTKKTTREVAQQHVDEIVPDEPMRDKDRSASGQRALKLREEAEKEEAELEKKKVAPAKAKPSAKGNPLA